MDLIKGYVQYYGRQIPVTWEDETDKYAKNVRKIHIQNDILFVDQRIFDDKVNKKEIYLIKSSCL